MTFVGALVLLAGIWAAFIAPQLTSLGNNFSYSSNILSLDNFYNEEKGEYEGEIRSVTEFSYRTIGVEGQVGVIENSFIARKTSGEEIFSTSRLYGVDLRTKEHVPKYGDKDREGYLFAPEFVSKEKDFTYWHVNYDAPARMKFAEETTLFGLGVYRFDSVYEGVSVDQTENLKHLPGVGETRGVILEPTLSIWVEPVTGYLVKYKDKATAYYYDLETGEKLNPWNTFSNTVSQESVQEHVELAKDLKRKEFFYTIAVPVAIIIAAAVAASASLIGIIPAFATAFVGLLFLFVGSFFFFSEKNQEEMLAIGILRWTESASIEANVQGFKDGLAGSGFHEGAQVRFIEPPASSGSKETHEMNIDDLLDADVDLIYSLTTPGTLTVKEKIEDLPVVFSVVTYPVESGVVETLQRSGNNFTGTRLWVPMEDQYTFFSQVLPEVKKVGFLRRTGESNSTVQLGEFKKVTEKRGVEVVDISVEEGFSFEDTFGKLRGEIDAVYLSCDTLVQSGALLDELLPYLLVERLPSFSCSELAIKQGSLLGIVADFYDIGTLSGQKAGLVLQGIPPKIIPTVSAPKPTIVVNKKTAELLDINFSQEVLSAAERVY